MNNTKCPACSGYETTSARPNLMTHIKNRAKNELLANHVLGKGSLVHANWIKNNFRIVQPKKQIKVGKTMILTLK